MWIGGARPTLAQHRLTDPVVGGRPRAGPEQDWKIEMNNIIWLVGAVVIVVVILGFLGLR